MQRSPLLFLLGVAIADYALTGGIVSSGSIRAVDPRGRHHPLRTAMSVKLTSHLLIKIFAINGPCSSRIKAENVILGAVKGLV